MIVFCESNFFPLTLKLDMGNIPTFSLVLEEYWSLGSFNQGVPFRTVFTLSKMCSIHWGHGETCMGNISPQGKGGWISCTWWGKWKYNSCPPVTEFSCYNGPIIYCLLHFNIPICEVGGNTNLPSAFQVFCENQWTNIGRIGAPWMKGTL